MLEKLLIEQIDFKIEYKRDDNGYAWAWLCTIPYTHEAFRIVQASGYEWKIYPTQLGQAALISVWAV